MAIVAEFSNSVNVTKQALAAQRTLHPVTAQDARTPAQRFRDGFDAYCGGLSIMDIYDPDEQRGWWSANSAQGETETDGYADRAGW